MEVVSMINLSLTGEPEDEKIVRRISGISCKMPKRVLIIKLTNLSRRNSQTLRSKKNNLRIM